MDAKSFLCCCAEVRLSGGKASAPQARWNFQPKHTDRSRLIVRRFVEAYRVSWTFLAQVRETGTFVASHFDNALARRPYCMHISCHYHVHGTASARRFDMTTPRKLRRLGSRLHWPCYERNVFDAPGPGLLLRPARHQLLWPARPFACLSERH